jgi:hypothetical protein
MIGLSNATADGKTDRGIMGRKTDHVQAKSAHVLGLV